jgi:hypothetical protein
MEAENVHSILHAFFQFQHIPPQVLSHISNKLEKIKFILELGTTNE